MNVKSIIDAVRLCYDEEAKNEAELVDVTDDVATENNIVKARIADALRWICMYAPETLLAGGDVGNSSVIVDAEIQYESPETEDGGIRVGEYDSEGSVVMKMPSDFMRLVRIRLDSWHKAVANPFPEDSEESLMAHDSTVTPNEDRPMVISRKGRHVSFELWPCNEGNYIYVSYVRAPEIPTTGFSSDATEVGVPPLLQTSFVYYLAFLVLSAYGDPRAERMLDIARMNLAINENRQ